MASGEAGSILCRRHLSKSAKTAPGPAPLINHHALLSPRLIERITGWYGAPLIGVAPSAGPDGDQTSGLSQHLVQWENADVVLFPDIGPGDLDGFFCLRLLQVIEERPPLAALSVILLSAFMAGPPLAGGFEDRFRSAWPFARCVFLTEGNDHAALSARLGVPVGRFDDAAGAPSALETDARAGQKIAVHVQSAHRRCGGTILLENQVQSLVRAGFLTIRVFTDPQWRRGATLRSRLDAVIGENGLVAGAHINAVAVPDGPPPRVQARDPDVTWRIAATASCRIHDDAITRGAGQAECVIANQPECLGPAITLAPRARLMFALHEDRAVALHQWAILAGQGEAAAMKSATAVARVQARILTIPDICSFVSASEMTRLGPHCRRAVAVLPHVGSAPPRDVPAAAFDLLLVGSDHDLNVVSLRWFLDRVWRPHLEARSVSVAIVGRVGARAFHPRFLSPLLHFLGFVEDLETIRSWCRLTVVPDAGGAGLSIKMLATLASGHPMATTSIGLRGLDPSITATLPAHNTADTLAADILGLLDSPDRLTQRQRLVRAAAEALGGITDHAGLIMAAARPTGAATRERRAQWSAIVGTPPPEPAPYLFVLDIAFSMSGSPWDQQVLLDGWHEPEPWGRWTDGADATLRITLAAPVSEPLTLQLDIVPSAVCANLRVGVDGMMFPLADPVAGMNGWDLPAELTTGKAEFVVSLHVGETICPAATGNSPDDRVLGIGVSAVRLLSRQPTLCELDVFMPIRADAMPSQVLLTGWHRPEDWGCWTNRTTASLRLETIEPLKETVRLELNLAPTAIPAPLTLSVNGVTLAPTIPAEGPNIWDLPQQATIGRTELNVLLTVSEMFCAARIGLSADDRELGVGLRGIRLVPVVTAFYEPGTTLRLAGPAALGQFLLNGWHQPEDGGPWTGQHDASLCLRFRQPLFGPFRLEMDLAPPPVLTTLTLSVNGMALPGIMPADGVNRWSLPETLINGQQTLLLELQVADTFRQRDVADSTDRRVLGIGVRGVGLHREAPAVCPIGTLVPVSSDAGDRGILLAGWYAPETWGCWSSGPAASMLLRFDAPLEGVCKLEIDVLPPLLDASVTLSANDVVLDPLAVVNGINEWTLPRSCTSGHTDLLVHLLVPSPARPMDVKDSKDDRILGVGVRSIRLLAASRVA